MKRTIFPAVVAIAVALMGTANAHDNIGQRSNQGGNCPHCGQTGGNCPNGNCGNSNCRSGNCGNGKRGNGAYGNAHQPYGSPYPVGRRAQTALAYPWHCNYYHTQWGSPVALVIPPTAERQYSMGWGVGNTRLTRNYHQFGRPYPGQYPGEVGQRFQATPNWPSDTSQFGAYYVRGPW